MTLVMWLYAAVILAGALSEVYRLVAPVLASEPKNARHLRATGGR